MDYEEVEGNDDQSDSSDESRSGHNLITLEGNNTS